MSGDRIAERSSRNVKAPCKPVAQARAVGWATSIQFTDINTFLHYGYSIRIDEEDPFPFDMRTLDELDPKRYSQMSMTDLIEHGKDALLRSVQDELSRTTAKTHVVPLSGGLDSRAILSSLLKLGLRDKITTVCFGAPNAPDYEIAKVVSHRAGVRHLEINISKTRFGEDMLIDVVKRSHTLVPPFHISFNQLTVVEGPDSVIWYGFMGGEVSGAHYYTDPDDWAEARRLFAHRNRYTRCLQLHSGQFSPVSVLPDAPLLSGDRLPFCLQLDYAVRQKNYIKPCLSPADRSVVFPFTNPHFLGYFFSVPRRCWVEQSLYKEILSDYDPVLFGLPATNFDGLSYEQWKSRGSRLRRRLRSSRDKLLSVSAPALRPAYRFLFPRAEGYGYLSYKGVSDFDASLAAVVRNSVRDLQNRRILDWLDIDGIVDSHTSGKQNCAKELEVLAGLELNLKARERFAGGETDAHG